MELEKYLRKRKTRISADVRGLFFAVVVLAVALVVAWVAYDAGRPEAMISRPLLLETRLRIRCREWLNENENDPNYKIVKWSRVEEDRTSDDHEIVYTIYAKYRTTNIFGGPSLNVHGWSFDENLTLFEETGLVDWSTDEDPKPFRFRGLY